VFNFLIIMMFFGSILFVFVFVLNNCFLVRFYFFYFFYFFYEGMNTTTWDQHGYHLKGTSSLLKAAMTQLATCLTLASAHVCVACTMDEDGEGVGDAVGAAPGVDADAAAGAADVVGAAVVVAPPGAAAAAAAAETSW
jgi:hypothetical protein